MGKKSMAINKKTHWYVIQFLAHYIVFDKAMKNEAYAHPGVHLHEHKIEKGGSLSQLAKRHNLPLEGLKAHNTWVLKTRIPNDKEYTVYLPLSSPHTSPTPEQQISSAGTLSIAANLLDTLHDVWERLDTQTLYAVRINRLPATVAQEGENLEDLIERSGLSQQRFLRYNDIDETHEVVQGAIYYLKRKRGVSRAYYHIVQPHETLWQIAQSYGTRLKNLMRNNDMGGASVLVPYTRLWLSRKRPAYDANEPLMPHPPEPQDEAEDSSGTMPHETREKLPLLQADWHPHKVRPKENLHAIAEKYGVSVQQIAEWNQIENVGKIQEGLVLYLDIPHSKRGKAQAPSSPKKDTPDKPDTTDYRVKSGDTLHSIAKKTQNQRAATQAAQPKEGRSAACRRTASRTPKKRMSCPAGLKSTHPLLNPLHEPHGRGRGSADAHPVFGCKPRTLHLLLRRDTIGIWVRRMAGFGTIPFRWKT